jgi:pyruvate/2-oxoglutarate dehydrogenase complex dihydrolipoamide dehydrogenase (E3) component
MAKKHTFDYDLIVIGSGAGGSAAATLSARAGKRVAIIEEDTFGGDSPNYSDIPTKALLHAAQLYDEAKHLAVKRTGAGGNKRYYETNKVTAIKGRAHFLSPHEITVNRRHLSAAKFLIATGSTWVPPSIQGLDKTPHLTPRTLLEVMRPPKSLFIIGGGQTGIELAQLMATFGTKVYIAEIASRILPKLDQDVGQLMEKTLADQKGITSLTQSRVVAVQKDGIGRRVTYSRGGVEKHVRVDEILVATGRMPAVDLGLENATVEFTPKGIAVNEFLQTNVKHIYAAGDVLGNESTTHTALLESRTVAHNLFTRTPISPDYHATPRVVFTNPGIAQVGLTEDDCTRRDLRISVATAPLSMVARSNTSDFRDGFVKLIADKKGTLLGATVVAPHASEIIHELTLAIRHHMTAAQVADTPHAFLSWSEAVRAAANKIA